jgi:hypothetical protein
MAQHERKQPFYWLGSIPCLAKPVKLPVVHAAQKIMKNTGKEWRERRGSNLAGKICATL